MKRSYFITLAAVIALATPAFADKTQVFPVRPEEGTFCESDLQAEVKKVKDRLARDGILATGRAVLGKLDQPIPLGYSAVGRVIAVGEDVVGIAVGDRVACAGAKVANHAEINLVPKNLCAKIPEGLSDEAANVRMAAKIRALNPKIKVTTY